MKSKEEGINTAVLALCTADFNTLGKSCAPRRVRILQVMGIGKVIRRTWVVK